MGTIMYSNNNTAKEYVLQEIDALIKRTGSDRVSVLDFACGTCSIWRIFLKKHANMRFYGFDFNPESIKKAQVYFPEFKDTIVCSDGQKDIPFHEKFDVITSFSSLEHVVDRRSFIHNMKNSLADGGVEYLNYDLGHFRSGIINNIVNLASQLLALLKITEKYYTKNVSLAEVEKILRDLSLEVMNIKFFNITTLKNIHKEIRDGASLAKWFEYELSLNDTNDRQVLEKNLSSIVITFRKK